MNLLPFDYSTNQTANARGLARTASLIEQARAEATNSILLDNGDFLSGTLLGDVALEAEANGTPHPIIASMNALAYDAATLGNHDFDNGDTVLLRTIEKAAFPYVLSNVELLSPDTGQAAANLPLAPHLILERQVTDTHGKTRQLRIGVIGLVPPRTLRSRAPMQFHLQARDMAPIAAALVPKLRQAGADIVLALAHTGFAPDPHSPPGAPEPENAITQLAQVPGLDAIIGGHAHQVFPDAPGGPSSEPPDPDLGHVNGVPVVIPGFWGSHLGVIDLEVTFPGTVPTPEPTTRAERIEARPIYQRSTEGDVTALVASAPEIVRLVTQAHDAALHLAQQPIGCSDTRLHSYFSLLTPSPVVQLIQVAQRDYVRRVLADGPHGRLPVLSSASPFKCGGISGPDHYTDIPAGTLTQQSLSDLYVYSNDLVALRVDGAFLRDWLERAVSVYNHLRPGQVTQTVIDLETPCYLCESVLGLHYRIDPSRPARFTARGDRIGEHQAKPGRIRDLSHAGAPVQPDQEFILVTNGFRTQGGGGYPGIATAQRVLEEGTDIRDVLRQYLALGKVAQNPPDRHWSLTSPPTTQALFDCAPNAANLVPELPGVTIRPGPLGANGFRRFRLQF